MPVSPTERIEYLTEEKSLGLLSYWSNRFVKENPSLEYDDLYQEGFFGLCRAFKTYDKGIAAFTTYANSFVRNSITAYVRKCRKEASLPLFDQEQLLDDSLTGLDLLVDVERRRAIRVGIYKSLKSLPKRTRRCVLMRFLCDRTYEEIASHFGDSSFDRRKVSSEIKSVLPSVRKRFRVFNGHYTSSPSLSGRLKPFSVMRKKKAVVSEEPLVPCSDELSITSISLRRQVSFWFPAVKPLVFASFGFSQFCPVTGVPPPFG